jgi:hypothetical protein
MNRLERAAVVAECREAFGLDPAKVNRLAELLDKMEERGQVSRSELEEIVGSDKEHFARFLDILGFNDPDAESPEESEAYRRIAVYLKLNNFENLKDAAKKGWGDTSPLGSHLFAEVRCLIEADQREKH